MAHSTEAHRRAPQRRFENYILTRLVDPSAGLTDVPDVRFTQAPGSAGVGYTDDAVTSAIPIGFDFQFDGITYKHFVVSNNGWMVLVDPTIDPAGFTLSDVLTSGISYLNTGIKALFTNNHALLAPWFDDNRNICSDPSQLSGAPFSYSATKIARISTGLEPPPIFYNPTSYGVSFHVDARSPQGRRLIIRWAVATNYVSPTSVVRFEVVIYENGTIEYRYSPRATIVTPNLSVESATIGVFMPGQSNRFRDFSVGLGYRENSRQEYIYGGYVYDATYTDNAVPYTSGLIPNRNWPGLASAGCVLRFAPPKNRRRVLPRKLSGERDSRNSYPNVSRTGMAVKNFFRFYDDRKSPEYSVSGAVVTTQVNYPTTMPRFFGGSGLGTSERQDLMAGDFMVSGTVVKSVIDQYVDEQPALYMDAFNESSRPDQGPSAMMNSFFTTGSSSDYLPQGFDHNLRSKTHVRFSLPVNTNVTLPGASSSIYYYNKRSKAWSVPSNSTYVLATGGSTPPVGNTLGDWKDPMSDVVNGRIVEDGRGFGPIGNILSSGSGTPTGAQQTDSAIGSAYDHRVFPAVVGKTYTKSVRNNEQYRAADDETFTIPINTPFLIEKAVFEISMSAGPGWFNDKTQCFMPFAGASSFDFGGPALTLALFRQVMLSEKGQTSVRDLILTGTITHTNDNVKELSISAFPPHSSTYQVRPVGFLAYANPPGAVVRPAGNNTFTGSVEVQAAALTATGIGVRYIRNFTGTSAQNRSNVVDFVNASKTPTLVLSSTLNVSTSVGYVSPLGRAGTGFDQAGRAVLGKEFITLQGQTDQTGRLVANPFATASLSTQHSEALTTSVGTFNVVANAVIPVVSHFPSPYLVMPGDKLVLALSKMRPVMYGNGSSIGWFSGSTHDVNLSPGTINVTLYGSLIQDGAEFHDTQNQNLDSNVVHELIGAEPVLDQFEVAYRQEYTGSFTDNVIFGTLGASSTRDRKLSKLNARNVPALGTSPSEILINAYKGYRLQPWHEKFPDVRLSAFADPTERYWDSMMPSVADSFRADGVGIFIAPPGTFGDFRQVDTSIYNASASVVPYEPNRRRVGWIMMDNLNPDTGTTYVKIVNMNWNKAFPFEPRYQGSSRQLDVANSLLATYQYSPYTSPVVQAITPVQVTGLIFGTVELGSTPVRYYFPPFFDYTFYYTNYPLYSWLVDSNLSGRTNNSLYATYNMPAQMYATASMASDDTNRALFGFGDRNTCYQTSYSGGKVLMGTNHYVDTRDVEGPHPDGVWSYFDISNFRFSPVIRGWKYGVYSGIAAFSKAYYRRDRFGQFRDMMEQRPFTKFYQSPENSTNAPNFQQGVQPAAVTVTFLDPSSGRLTAPDNTWSSNLHFECTSSFPFFDGVALNRPDITAGNLNLHPNVVRHDSRGNIHIG